MSKELIKAKSNLSKLAFENLQKWLLDEKYHEFKAQILNLIKNEDWDELEDAFFKILEFGTAGRRGRVGAGPNRINLVTISESAQALANYLKSLNINSPSVAIAWDVRNSSCELSKKCAEILAANNIKVFYFDTPHSTPELSFTVRNLKTSAGIVISASHNPPEDNGIKIYWNDGAQISAPHDKKLMKIAKNIEEFKTGDFDEFVKNGKIKILGEENDYFYIKANAKLSLSKNRNAKIIFSPIHGTGTTNLLKTLQFAGFENIILVDEQMNFDGNFSTLQDRKPNPENLSANRMAILKLRKERADIALTTDPDADRICVMSLEKNGEVRSFSGNQTAILVTDYILSKKQKDRNKYAELYFGKREFICKSFVTTDVLNVLAKKYGVKIYDDLLVGFKFIGRKILQKETFGEKFIAGFELMIAELVSELKLKNQTLGEKLDEIYAENGYFIEKTESLEFSGAEGFAKMQEIMQKMRIGNKNFGALKMRDFENLSELDFSTNKKNSFKMLENGNAVSFIFDSEDRRITIRPSGTEPKMKIYAQWRFENKQDCVKIENIVSDFKEKILDEC